MSPLLADIIPQVAPDVLGQWVLCFILVVYLATLIKRLMGWDKPPEDAAATKRELFRLSAKVDNCATKDEVDDLRKEITSKYDKLEQYSRDRSHDTINAVNVVQLNLERMRVELIEKVAVAHQRLEDRLNEFLVGRVDGGKRGG